METRKSTFVSVVGWLFLVGSGFASLIGIMQNIMMWTMFPIEEMQRSLEVAKKTGNVPAISLFMLEYMRFFVFGFLLLSVTAFVSTIGLLRRREWARKVFSLLLVLGAVIVTAGLLIQVSMPAPSIPSEETDFDKRFAYMHRIIMVFSVLISISIVIAFGWITRKLHSVGIRDEFR